MSSSRAVIMQNSEEKNQFPFAPAHRRCHQKTFCIDLSAKAVYERYQLINAARRLLSHFPSHWIVMEEFLWSQRHHKLIPQLAHSLNHPNGVSGWFPCPRLFYLCLFQTTSLTPKINLSPFLLLLPKRVGSEERAILSFSETLDVSINTVCCWGKWRGKCLMRNECDSLLTLICDVARQDDASASLWALCSWTLILLGIWFRLASVKITSRVCLLSSGGASSI